MVKWGTSFTRSLLHPFTLRVSISMESIMSRNPTPIHWSDAVMQVFHAQRIRQVAYVPDTGLKRLIELVRADKAIQEIPLTTEEEGVALAVGACLGGERAVLLLQSSGTGNCNRLGPGARATETPRAGDHRRRRHADGDGQLCDYRCETTEEPRDHRHGQ